MLYPPEFLQALPVAGPHERAALVNLNTHRPSVLRTLHRWFAEMHPDGHADLRGRLRSRDSAQFIPALYEILVHRYCFNRGWGVRRDYQANGGNPDLYITHNQWCVEIATVGESQDEDRDNREIDEICRLLEQIESPFWMSIAGFEFKRVFATKRNVLAWAEQQILNHNEDNEFEARYAFEDGESYIDFAFARKGPDARGNVGVKGMYSHDFEASKGRMLTRLRAKARKYDLDLVIFLCSGGGFWGVHDETLDECLYGDRVPTFDRRTLQITGERRKSNGFFTKREGGAPRNRRVAAVVLCERRIVSEADDLGIEMVVYHNPYARRRLDKEMLNDCKQFAVTSEAGDAVTMSWINVNVGPVALR